MRYAFIEAHQKMFRIKTQCRVLGVSESGYYAWRKRTPSARAQADGALLTHIEAIHAESRATYGSPRVWAALRQQGVCLSRKRVVRLMRAASLRGCARRKRRPQGTQTNAALPVAPNVLGRDFSASAPNQKWLGDISYLETREGWLYLASIQDVFSRKIVGWAMSAHPDEALVSRALAMALQQRQVGDGLLHHSDRGSQYAATDYQTRLAKAHITVSMSRKGNCWDNAMKESFFATLKTECASRPFATRAEAKSAVFAYIEGWYNRRRLHSALGYLSPDQFERTFARSV